MRKLHLGCGNIHLDGWINIDIRETEASDIVTDISTLNNIDDNSVDEIYVCHVLEHFKLVGENSYKNVLQTWVNKLKVGGIIKISVPNLEAVLNGFMQYDLNRDKVFDFQRLLFGGQDYSENIHYTGFTPTSLQHDMLDVGLTNISAFWPFVEDTSQFVLHGYTVSLNLQGEKSNNN